MKNQYIMTIRSKDRMGLVAAITTCLFQNNGFINELAQYGTPKSKRFYLRIRFTMDSETMEDFTAALNPINARYGMKTKIIPVKKKTPTLIMVSKFDHCLNDILYRTKKGTLNIDIKAIVSNHSDAQHHGELANIPFHHIPITKETKAEAEAKLKSIIRESGAELIVLARYMQILSEDMCAEFSSQIINIHHSFLPSFKGAKPYHRAFERGVKLMGATAHYVTTDLDEGPIIEQKVTRIDHTKTANEMVAIGRDVEAHTLAEAIRLHSEHRVFLNEQKTVIL